MLMVRSYRPDRFTFVEPRKTPDTVASRASYVPSVSSASLQRAPCSKSAQAFLRTTAPDHSLAFVRAAAARQADWSWK